MLKVVYPYLRVLVAEVRGGCRRVEILFTSNRCTTPSFYVKSESPHGVVEIWHPTNPKDVSACIERAQVMAETSHPLTGLAP